MLTVTTKLNGSIYSLEQRLLVDTSDDKVALVDSLWTLCRGADADGWKWVAYRSEEAGFLWKGTGVGYDSEGVHLEAVVVVESERFLLVDTRIENESTGRKAIA